MNNTSNTNTIHDTDIVKIKTQINTMLELLDQNTIKSELILKNRFNYLFTTSPTLFNFILKNHTTQDRDNLLNKINMMLSLINKIQNSEISLYDASAKVGQEMADEYITPKLNNEQK